MSAEEKRDLEQNNQALLKDKVDMEKEMDQVTEEALDGSIARGIELGKRRTVRRKRKRLSLGMCLAAVSIMFMLTAFVRVSPAFAEMMKEIPGLSGFVELIQGDKTLMSAINNDFIQPVNESVEKNGYKLTVDGIIADDQRLVIIYTAEGPGLNGDTGFLNYNLKTDDGGDVVAAIVSSHFPTNEKDKADAPIHDYLDILMSDGVPMPNGIQFGLMLGNEWLEIDIPIDHSQFAGMREEIELNQSFEVSGQRFMINKVIITPLQVSLMFEADANNDKRANHFINMALVDEKGRRYETSTGFGDLNPLLTRHFKSSYFEKPKQLTFEADGMYLSENHLSLTIDTDKVETISSPNNKLQLVGKEQVAEGYDLTFELMKLDEIDMQLGYTLFKHQGTFKDTSGTIYPLLDRSGTAISWSASEDKVSYFYRIPKADYKQPLTFDIEQFPGYVMEPIRIRIK